MIHLGFKPISLQMMAQVELCGMTKSVSSMRNRRGSNPEQLLAILKSLSYAANSWSLG